MHVATLMDSQRGIGNAVVAAGTFFTCNCVFIGTDSGYMAAYVWQPLLRHWGCVGVVPPPAPCGDGCFVWSSLEITEDIPGGCFHSKQAANGTRFLICGVLQAKGSDGTFGPPIMFVRNCDVDHTFTTLQQPAPAPSLDGTWPMFKSTSVYQHAMDWPLVAGAQVLSASVCKLPPLVTQLLMSSSSTEDSALKGMG